MFTSRAEWRLMLRADSAGRSARRTTPRPTRRTPLCRRADNADARLTPLGAACGLVGERRLERLREKQAAMQRGLRALRGFALPNAEWAAAGFGVKPNGEPRAEQMLQPLRQSLVALTRWWCVCSSGELRTAEQMLHVPRAELCDVEAAMAAAPHGWRKACPEGASLLPLPSLGREAMEIEVKYSNYLERQAREVARLEEHAMASIPRHTDYAALPCLSKEEAADLAEICRDLAEMRHSMLSQDRGSASVWHQHQRLAPPRRSVAPSPPRARPRPAGREAYRHAARDALRGGRHPRHHSKGALLHLQPPAAGRGIVEDGGGRRR